MQSQTCGIAFIKATIPGLITLYSGQISAPISKRRFLKVTHVSYNISVSTLAQ